MEEAVTFSIRKIHGCRLARRSEGKYSFHKSGAALRRESRPRDCKRVSKAPPLPEITNQITNIRQSLWFAAWFYGLHW